MQQRLADEVRNLVLVTEAGQAFGRQDSESGLLESMTRSARILFDFEHTVILLENPASGELVGAPAPGLARVAELTIPLGRGGVLAGVALRAAHRLRRPQRARTGPGRTAAAAHPGQRKHGLRAAHRGRAAWACWWAAWPPGRCRAASSANRSCTPSGCRPPSRSRRPCPSGARRAASWPRPPKNSAKRRAAWCTR
ncbi:hypothetical protein LP420_23825 [Massilia sp. B-10]|nr:hypothetical protein LP420_23825 [Massilia sp. B-10]